MNTLQKLNAILTKGQKVKLSIFLLLLFISALLELMGVSLILPLVQMFMSTGAYNDNQMFILLSGLFDFKTYQSFLIFLSILLIGVYTVKNLYLGFMNYLLYSFLYNNQMKMSAKLMEAYMKKDYTFHLQTNTSDITRSVIGDVSSLFSLITNLLLLVSEGLVTLLLIAYLMVTDALITLFVLVFLVLFTLVFLKIFRKKLIFYGRENQHYGGRLIQYINESIGGIKEIKIMNREKYFVDSFAKSSLMYGKNLKWYAVINQMPRLLIETLCITSLLIAIILKIVNGGDMTNLIPQLSAFAVVAFRLLPAVNKINIYINAILYGKPSIDVIYKDIQSSNSNSENSLINSKECNTGETNTLEDFISVINVSYRYPNMQDYVLKNITFNIPIKKATAFIGKSGAGKTTIADIILGILVPDEGSVIYKGMNIHNNIGEWSKRIGYIPQNIYLADGTIKNNIAFGIEEETINEEQIWNALEKAQLKDFVMGLDGKIDALIGEQGVRLSGGQRQRIGIARALYSNPEILVLDEATSALDNETETAVMEAIEQLHGEKTLIIIAHRLSTIQNCDYVFCVEEQKIFLQQDVLKHS